MKDQETKNRFVELRAEGWSFQKIATELQTSKNTLIAWSQNLELEIRNAKEVHLDALKEMFFLTRVARIEGFGKQLKKISDALEKRDFDGMETEKLLTLFMKLHGSIDAELADLRFSKKGNLLDEDMGFTKTWTA